MNDVEYLGELAHEATGDGMPLMSVRITGIADHYEAMYEVISELSKECSVITVMEIMGKCQQLLAKIDGKEITNE